MTVMVQETTFCNSFAYFQTLKTFSALTAGVFPSPKGSYAGFVYTYAVSPPLLMGHKAAGCLDSIFWASITIGRLAFIYVSYKYTAPRLLAFSLVRTQV